MQARRQENLKTCSLKADMPSGANAGRTTNCFRCFIKLKYSIVN